MFEVSTESSVLVSSSKYLNHAGLRDWLAMICLRRNGPDFPAAAELPRMMSILTELRDHDRIEELFREERKRNAELDAWFEEGFLSSPATIHDYGRYGPGTLGGTFHELFVGRFEVQIASHQWTAPNSQFEFFRRRQIQNHDLEHILVGGGIDALGELVPSWFRMTNIPRFVIDQELAAELLIINLMASLRYTVRTMLHYPQVWSYCADAIHRGSSAGAVSDPLFMQKLEPYLDWPLGDARRALGLRMIVQRDTSHASEFWTETTSEPPPPLNLR